jgi:hypothetical protein
MRLIRMILVRASGSMRRSLAVSAIAVAALGSALAGCAGGSGPASSAPPVSAGSVSAAAKSTSLAGSTATEASPKALCRGLPTADVAALFKGSVGPVQLGTGSVTCTYAPAGKGSDLSAELSIVIDPTFGAATYPNTARALGASPKAISGVGDKAVWASPQPGYGAPNVVALKGKTSCYLQAPSDISVLTLQTGNDSQVSDAAAAAFAQKLAALCADAFAGK